jgi:hypothetical protein
VECTSKRLTTKRSTTKCATTGTKMDGECVSLGLALQYNARLFLRDEKDCGSGGARGMWLKNPVLYEIVSAGRSLASGDRGRPP